LSRSDAAVSLDGRIARKAGSLSSNPLFDLGAMTTAGTGDLRVLYESPGYSKWGESVEDLKGLAEARLIPATPPDLVLVNCQMKQIDGTQDRPEVAVDFDDSSWQELRLRPGSCPGPINSPGAFCAFRTGVNLSAEDLAAGSMSLVFDCIDDHGWIYV